MAESLVGLTAVKKVDLMVEMTVVMRVGWMAAQRAVSWVGSTAG